MEIYNTSSITETKDSWHGTGELVIVFDSKFLRGIGTHKSVLPKTECLPF